jgi:tetratricopeptide (TPR) repeat protein
MKASSIVAACATFLLATTAPAAPAASGDTDAAGKTDVELAKRHYKLGEEMFARSDFEEAVDHFEKAHELSGRPELLYNIGRCHEFMGNLEEAIEVYEAFVASDHDLVPVVEKRVANLKEKLARRQEAGADGAGSGPVEGAREGKPLLPLGPLAPERGRGLRISGWVLVGAGVASLAAGAALGAVAAGKASDLEEAAAAHQPWADHRASEDQGEALELGQIISLAAGGAAAATGAVLLYLGHRGEERGGQRAWIAPSATASGPMLVGTWRF